jgi:hypothetical protein
MTDTPKRDELVGKQHKRQMTFSMPLVLSQRLDDLCRLLNTEGQVGTIHRQELVAALIGTASEQLVELEKLIGDYRALKIKDVLVGDEKGAEVIELRPVKPGRRTV